MRGMAPLSEADVDSPSANTKGLLNGPGQNNCFLNSAVQVLWHLDIFRRSFRELSGHACMSEACIFCALKELFSQLQFSQESALPPDALRRALAETFFDQQRFQLGCMDDAAECFENILLRIHCHIARDEAEDMCSARHCIPHQKFAMTLVEQSVCDACKATSEPLPFTQMVHYVSASALTEQARQLAASTPAHSDLFGQLLKRAGGMGDIRDCPSNCGAKIQICRSLMNRPEIVSVGIVWDSERPTVEQIMAVLATVGTTLRLGDVFHSVVDQRWALSSQHALVGVVTYYGKHYSTFFFHTKLRLWIYFDDANVREVGPRWEQVVEKCRRGRYQPLLLLYAALGGSPVNTQDAPKFITPVTTLTASQASPHRPHRPHWANLRVAPTAAGGQNAPGAPCPVHPAPGVQRSSPFAQNTHNGLHPHGITQNEKNHQYNAFYQNQNACNGPYSNGILSSDKIQHPNGGTTPTTYYAGQNGMQNEKAHVLNGTQYLPNYHIQNDPASFSQNERGSAQNGYYTGPNCPNPQYSNSIERSTPTNGYSQGSYTAATGQSNSVNVNGQNNAAYYPSNNQNQCMPNAYNGYRPQNGAYQVLPAPFAGSGGRTPVQNGFNPQNEPATNSGSIAQKMTAGVNGYQHNGQYGGAVGVYQASHANPLPNYARASMPTAAQQANFILRSSTLPGSVTHLPPLSPGRRAMTPSPEKPGSSANARCNSPARRAVTPNPDTAKHAISDYQNLADMQAVIMAQTYPPPPNPLYRSNSVSGAIRKPVQRSNSSDSERSSVFTETEGASSNHRLGPRVDASGNSPRRRDSGNWSGDRNSASSSSSTSMENPYLYIVGRMQQRTGVLPRSPLAQKDSNGYVDPGYDSYSLSSTDSLPLQQGLKHTFQLAQIPETRSPIGQDCEGLCQEADDLMDRGKILEEAGDLEAAVILVQAACGKSRAAMDAPYNNPSNISHALMKHNSCVMGLRSLQKKIAGEKDGGLEIRHSRENSSSSLRGSGKGNHSRQNSRDSNKGMHSRQNSRELLTQSANAPSNSATATVTTCVGNSSSNKIIREMLPQPVVGVHDLSEKPNSIEIYATLPKKRGMLSRVKSKGNDSPTKNIIEDAEYLIYDRPGRKDKTSPTKEKRARSEERNKKPELKQEPEPKTKTKQHKIRRKLLMGGLIKRKNRSMPDLREDEDAKVGSSAAPLKTQDDSSIKNKEAKKLSGYLSEGHLEFAGNPNLERSRLMRKTVPVKGSLPLRVPPPPPLRTTSQLSKPKPKLPPFLVRDDPVQYANVQGMVTRAEVHRPPIDDENDLPPYPTPPQSASHSRQASEEFPPPPDEILKDSSPPQLSQPAQGSFLLQELQAKLQSKTNQMDSEDVVDGVVSKEVMNIKELASRLDQIRMDEISDAKPATNFTTSVLKLTGADDECGLVRRKSGGKKKNVTFCDQVVLVATADDDQDDSYIPNPILERVLRSAMNKDETFPTATESPMNQTMLQSRMHIPLCAPERSKPPPQYNPPPQADAPRPYMQVPVKAFEVNGRGSITQPDQSASVRLGVNKSPYMPVPTPQLPANKSAPYYHPLPNRLNQQTGLRSKIVPPYQQPPQPKEVPCKTEPARTNQVSHESSSNPSQNAGARTIPCHLCRKKLVALPAMYCPDCDFYMSRFRQKAQQP